MLPAVAEGEPSRALERGWRAYQAGKVAEALSAYREAVAAAPDDASLWYDLGCLYALQGNSANARAALEQALALDVRLAAAHDALGQLDELDGQALARYEQARQLEPDNPKFLRHLIRVWLATNGLDQARAGLRQLLSLSPDDLEGRHLLAILELQAGAPDLAAANFSRVVHSQPDHVMAWNGLGLAQARLGRYEEARRSLERARQLAPDDPRTRTNLGVLAAYQQHWDDARTAWQTALEQEPRFAPAVQGEATLRALIAALYS